MAASTLLTAKGPLRSGAVQGASQGNDAGPVNAGLQQVSGFMACSSRVIGVKVASVERALTSLRHFRLEIADANCQAARLGH